MSEKLSERLGEFSVFGVVETLEERGEWTAFHIMLPGNQYPFKVSTKSAETIEKGRAHKGPQGATWHVNAVLSDKINPNSNKPYVNRFLNDVEAGNTVPAEGPGPDEPQEAAVPAGGNQTGTTGTMTPADWNAKERRDFRSRAWAQTLATFEHTIATDDDPLAVFTRLQPFQRKIYEDVCQSFAYPADDSDIPF